MRGVFSAIVLLTASAALFAAAGAAERPAKADKRPIRVTSKSAYYDRKKGVSILTGKVFVDDEEYQLHADRAYLFMAGTNDLKRIVAIGNVAMTNETRRAYGVKASYYRDTGLVILYGDTNQTMVAEVRDERPGGAQIVRGQKIKFWVNAEQVEVIEAEITAPAQGFGGLKDLGL